MFDIAIVGDVHISPSVSSRKDNYFDTCLQKIEEIASKCKNIIFLGDVFNSPTIAYNYFADFYSLLSKLKARGNNFYSILGNHDVFNEREDSRLKTSLGLAYVTNLITLILPDKPIKIGSYTFHTSYVSFDKAKKHLSNLKLDKLDILLLHHYFEDQYEGFCYEDLKNIGCDKIFFGHEHSAFEKGRKQFNEFTAYRCGSLLRNSSIEYNLKRTIFYYVFDPAGIKCCSLDCMKPAEEVFTYEAFNQENLHKKQFLNNINEVISKYTNNVSTQNTFNIKTILEEINTPITNMQYIREKYELIGERFDNYVV